MNNLNHIIKNFISNKLLFKLIKENTREFDRLIFEEKTFEEKMFDFDNDGEYNPSPYLKQI